MSGSRVKPTIFLVTDVETTMKTRMVFDVAWHAIDRTGLIYDSGSYLSMDSVNLDAPWFKEKVGRYYKDVFERHIEPVKFPVIRFKFNRAARKLREKGHRVIFCAYNAGFDCRELGKTCQLLMNKQFLDPGSVDGLLDIWHFWAESCPLAYRARMTETGKNFSTTAESVYRYEFNDPGFLESHIGYKDVNIEAQILLKVLARKQTMPVVKSPAEFEARPWFIANERVKSRKLPLKEIELLMAA